MSPKNPSLTGALGWKLLERFGVQGVQFFLQIILARLLDPEHYGSLSLMVIFTALANTFVQRGFNTALIQNKDVTEEDYSSVLWVSLGIAAVLYGILFLAAPVIASLYRLQEIVVPFRVLALVLLPGAVNSVQLAKVSREMDFKKVFYSNVGAIVFSGAAGIAIAYAGGGVWALIAQTMLNTLIACIVMQFTVKWRIRFVCDLNRIKVLFSYGWKLLVSGVINTLYTDLRSLVIGIKYNSATLGYYNRGKQFPEFLINAVDHTLQSVMLPAMSARQDDKTRVRDMMRNSVALSAYIIFPMMAGLAGVAPSLVELVLTEKWLPCVPYMQIYCFTLAFYPVHSCNLQAINAVGRSDLFLKLEVIKKTYGLLALVVAVVFFDSPIAIAVTGAITTIISCVVNASPNKKLIGYSYGEQMKDILPSMVLSLVMLSCVLLVEKLGLDSFATLCIQLVLGVAVYVALSAALKPKPFMQLLDMAKKLMARKRT